VARSNAQRTDNFDQKATKMFNLKGSAHLLETAELRIVNLTILNSANLITITVLIKLLSLPQGCIVRKKPQYYADRTNARKKPMWLWPLTYDLAFGGYQSKYVLKMLSG